MARRPKDSSAMVGAVPRKKHANVQVGGDHDHADDSTCATEPIRRYRVAATSSRIEYEAEVARVPVGDYPQRMRMGKIDAGIVP